MSATNIGIRPMFKVPTGQVEAHILDFNEDIYDRTVRVRPVRLLRGEARFETLQALVVQIERDCTAAINILKNLPPLFPKSRSKHIKNVGFLQPEG
jgi:riboflavin kinase/FMN adenylyltransferase